MANPISFGFRKLTDALHARRPMPLPQRLALPVSGSSIGNTRGIVDLVVLGATNVASTTLYELAAQHLPGYSTSLTDQMSHDVGAEGVFYRQIVIEPPKLKETSEKKIYVCLPTMNAKEKIAGFLDMLTGDLALPPTAVDVELLICANGCKDETEKEILRYLLQNPLPYRVKFQIIKGRVGKVRTVNLLQAESKRSLEIDRQSRGRLDGYTYFSDDDVIIVCKDPGKSGIKTCVKLIEEKHVGAVSGLYAIPKLDLDYKHPWETMWEVLNGVRRLPVYASEIAQIYGGGWACRIEDYPAEAVPVGLTYEDCYLSLHFFHRGKGVVATPELLLWHPIPDNMSDSLGRWLRDSGHWEELKRSLLELGAFSPDEIQAFHDTRKAGFAHVTEAIDGLPIYHPHRVANWANWQIRLSLMWLQNHDFVPSQFRISSLQFYRIKSGLPLSEMQASVRRNPYVLYQQLLGRTTEMIDALEKAECLDANEVRYLREVVPPYEALKRMEKIVLRAENIPQARAAAAGNQDLSTFLSLIEYSSRLRGNFLQPDFMRSLLKGAGIELQGEVRVSEVVGGKVGYAYRVTAENGSYFVKYTDVLGKDFTPIFEERKDIYYYLLNESFFRSFAGEERSVETIYPSLETARTHQAGPEFGLQKVLNRVVIQRDLSDQFENYDEEIIGRRERFSESKKAQARLSLYAGSLGKFHAASQGVRADLLNGTTKDSMVSAMAAIKDDLVGLSPLQHAKWLRSQYWRFSEFRKIFMGGANGTALLDFSPRERKELSKRWLGTVLSSANGLSRHGAIGHFDYKPQNCFIEREGDAFKVFDFKRAGFVDPALEAAEGLFQRLRNEWDRETVEGEDQVAEGKKIVETFVESYLSEFTLGEIEKEEIGNRIKEFCAYFIINGSTERRQNITMLQARELCFWLLG
ncbi:MAG: hypothetical protein WCV91_06560 [Candidatus Margulisiibacteriota bacterium]